MSEKIEIHDWVHHTKQKVIGKIMDTTALGDPPRPAFKVWVADHLPNQVWDASEVKLYQKRGTK